MLATTGSIVGTLPTWILVVVALSAAWKITRAGGGAAVAELQAANEVLTKALQHDREKFGTEIRDLRVKNGELQGRTDVAIALMPVIDWTTMHETRAQDRHAAMMKQQDRVIGVLDLIAERMGPEPNGNEHE